MFVTHCFYDLKNNGTYDEKEIVNPSWNNIEKLINQMDGKNITEVLLYNASKNYGLCIGGGNNELYNIYISYDDKVLCELTDETKSKTKTVQLVTGGQIGDFEEFLCVSKKIMLLVTKFFYDFGKPHNKFHWNIK